MKKLFLQRPAKTVLSLLLCTVLTASSPGSPMTAAAAGGLNADEQALLNDFAAGITVDGQLLQPPASYVALASDLLSSVDLSTSEVDRLYAKMDAAYDALRSEHITSVEEAQNSLAKNIVYAITSEAMQILENSPNKTDTSDDDDDEDYEDDNSDDDNGSGSTGSQQSNGNVGGQQDNNGNSQQNSNPAGGSGSSQQNTNPADGSGNSQQSSDTANGSSSDTAVSNGDASAAGTDSAATGEAADNSGQASDESPEAEMSIQMDGSDSSETGANASEKDAFPYPIAIGAAFILLAVTAVILFFRHRRDR